MNSIKPFELSSPGLVLRELTLADAGPLFNLIDKNREHLGQHGQTFADDYPTLDSMLESIVYPRSRLMLRMGIRPIELGIVGMITLMPLKANYSLIGYWVGQEYCRHGFATRAAALLVKYCAHHQGLEYLMAQVHANNTPSRKVLQRVGFKPFESESGDPAKLIYGRSIDPLDTIDWLVGELRGHHHVSNVCIPREPRWPAHTSVTFLRNGNTVNVFRPDQMELCQSAYRNQLEDRFRKEGWSLSLD